MNRWDTQEIDNAKSENEAWRFGQSRGAGGTTRRCYDRDHFGANDGEPGHREEDGPGLCEMPHRAAGAERLRKEIQSWRWLIDRRPHERPGRRNWPAPAIRAAACAGSQPNMCCSDNLPTKTELIARRPYFGPLRFHAGGRLDISENHRLIRIKGRSGRIGYGIYEGFSGASIPPAGLMTVYRNRKHSSFSAPNETRRSSCSCSHAL